jgi:hypothetical protein
MPSEGRSTWGIEAILGSGESPIDHVHSFPKQPEQGENSALSIGYLDALQLLSDLEGPC